MEAEQDARDRRPVRFGDQNPSFSDDFASQGLRNTNDNSPNLNNRGRFNPSRPRPDPIPDTVTREPRQEDFRGIMTFYVFMI